MPLYGFLRDGRPSALEGDALTVSLPSEFALRNAAQGDNAEVLAAAVEGVLGRRVTARFELAVRRRGPSRSARPLRPRRRPATALPTSPTRSVPRRPSSTPSCCPTSPKETTVANPQYNKMMKQVQEMQRKMAQAQEELAVETVEASAGGGIVTVVVTGSLEVKEVRINPDAVDPDDVEMLQDLVVAATNEALRAAQDLASTKLGGATGGLDLPNIPGLF